jgi:hypothetical protein
LASGVDPGEHRKSHKLAQSEQAANSFEVIAREWFAKHSTTWASSHSERTMRRLERDVFPWIGSRPIANIHAPEILTVLRRIEARGAGVLRALDGYQGTLTVRCAMRLAPLLFVRPGELRNAKWADMDLEEKQWRYTVTKTNTPHIVPLSRQAIEILNELHPLTGKGTYVFPSARTSSRPMSDNSILAAMRRAGIGANRDQPPRLLAVEGGKAVRLLCAICTENQIEKGCFLSCQLRLLFRFAQVWVYTNVVLSFVLAKVQNLEGSVVFACCLQLSLHTYKTFPCVWIANFPRSVAIHLRLSFSATDAVVPDPAKSATRSPSLLLALIIRSISDSGFCVE